MRKREEETRGDVRRRRQESRDYARKAGEETRGDARRR